MGREWHWEEGEEAGLWVIFLCLHLPHSQLMGRHNDSFNSLLPVAAPSMTKQVQHIASQTRAGVRMEWESGADCPLV